MPSGTAPGSPEIRSGDIDPLGVTPRGDGVNVALWAEAAESVEFCVFDEHGAETRYPLPESTFHTFHGHVAGIPVGTRYGFRVHGPWDPWTGRRFNAAKLLVDPYARAIDGRYQLVDAVFGHVHASGDDTLRDDRDSAPFVPRSVVVDDAFDWGTDALPRIKWADTVVYECHVKGMTALHPAVPEHQRGTYAGMAHPAVLEHLLSLGVTSVELLPVHHFVSEEHLLRRGLVNYWGYNTLGFFAPHAAYSSSGSRGEQVREFKAMVKSFHAAGLEVILDVVYNHTAEGNQVGPTLSMRGIDNASYYRLAEDRRFYADYTGCGNTLDVSHPHVLRLVMDSLALLGDGDARRRLPLRSRLRARPVVPRRRHARAVHADDLPGSCAPPGEADRGAVGRRGRRLPGGRVPADVDRVERQVPGHPARLLARRRGRRGRPGVAALRVGGPVRVGGPSAVRLDQLRDRPRRLHDARPGLLRRQAQRGERGGQPGRDGRQPVVELRGRGRDLRPGRHPRCGTARSATCSRRWSSQPGCR